MTIISIAIASTTITIGGTLNCCYNILHPALKDFIQLVGTKCGHYNYDNRDSSHNRDNYVYVYNGDTSKYHNRSLSYLMALPKIFQITAN